MSTSSGSALRGILTGVAAGVMAAAGVALTAAAGSVTPGGMGYARVEVTSIKEARFKNVIKQKFDFSCGSAALATLLTHHYEFPVTEMDVFDAMLLFGDEQKIRTQGFSLLDMKDFLEREGFTANGFKAPIDAFAQAKIPGIVLMNVKGYLHFVVVKGVSETEVLVGDPALGMKTYPRDDFEAMWNGIAFVIQNKNKAANDSFNQADAWKVRHSAPFGTALNRSSLASFNMLMPRPGDF
jgi:predicted double-glycine peptidase